MGLEKQVILSYGICVPCGEIDDWIKEQFNEEAEDYLDYYLGRIGLKNIYKYIDSPDDYEENFYIGIIKEIRSKKKVEYGKMIDEYNSIFTKEIKEKLSSLFIDKKEELLIRFRYR